MNAWPGSCHRRALRLPTVIWRCAGLLLLATVAGCGGGSGGRAEADTGKPGPAAGSHSAAADKPREYWEAQFLEGAKVGYAQFRRSTTVEDGQVRCVLRCDTRVTVKRAGQPVTQNLSYASTETPDGRVERFETTMSQGGSRTVTRGEVRDDTIHVVVTTPGGKIERDLAWDRSHGGFFGVEQTLENQPLKPGERRKLKSLVPFFLEIAEVQLEAFDYEKTALMDGERELLRIKKTIALGEDNQLVSWIWCDRAGQALKSRLVGGLGGESYRATKQVAMRDADDAGFDLFQSTTVKVKRRLANPHRTRRIAYRVRMDEGDPVRVFAADARQTVRRIDDQTAELVVQAAGLKGRAPVARQEDPPGQEYRAANSLVQSDHARIRQVAETVAPGEKDTAKLVAALEKFVGQYVERKDFSRAFATAAEVVETRQGDCTEHAVLLAALCRARDVPARVAIGLVYVKREGVFAYHMWNEVWVDNRWVPVDATLGLGGVGATHVKLRDTSLDGVGPYQAFLPVYRVLGQLSMDIVQVD